VGKFCVIYIAICYVRTEFFTSQCFASVAIESTKGMCAFMRDVSASSHLAGVLQLRWVTEHSALRKPCQEHHQQADGERGLECETNPRTTRRNRPTQDVARWTHRELVGVCNGACYW